MAVDQASSVTLLARPTSSPISASTMAANTVAISLGWGQGVDAGPIADGAGFDAYRVRTTASPGIADGATMSSTGGTYSFAQTQDHGAMDALQQQHESSP